MTLDTIHFLAAGGIGNKLAALGFAQAANRPVCWDSDFDRWVIDELYPNGAPVTFTDKPNGFPVWDYPAFDRTQVGVSYMLNHEGFTPQELLGYKPARRALALLPLSIDSITKPIFQVSDALVPPEGTVGVQLRAHHPRIPFDMSAAVTKLNRMTETSNVFVASDIALPGLSSAVTLNRGATLRTDADRSVQNTLKALRDLTTLSLCDNLQRNSPISTFMNPLVVLYGRVVTRFDPLRS